MGLGLGLRNLRRCGVRVRVRVRVRVEVGVGVGVRVGVMVGVMVGVRVIIMPHFGPPRCSQEAAPHPPAAR